MRAFTFVRAYMWGWGGFDFFSSLLLHLFKIIKINWEWGGVGLDFMCFGVTLYNERENKFYYYCGTTVVGFCVSCFFRFSLIAHPGSKSNKGRRADSTLPGGIRNAGHTDGQAVPRIHSQGHAGCVK